MNFIQALQHENNFTATLKGGTAYKSTNSKLLDLFGTIGSLRNKTSEETESEFQQAFSEDKDLALRMAFYARDCRGGLGERKTFRTILRYLAINYPGSVTKNIEKICEVGRFDDLFVLFDTPVEKAMVSFITKLLLQDIVCADSGIACSLLAKWMPSINTSSKSSVKMARRFAKAMSFTNAEYRKMLSKLRGYIDVTEKKMSSKQWNEIQYEKVASYCMLKNRNAFKRNDDSRFESYLEAVTNGESKINASTLYPYDIMRAIGLETSYNGSYLRADDDKVAESQWNALPNYVEGEQNVLIVADTSGSMEGLPLCTSVSLALYFAERNKGEFANKFITFSSKPQFVEVKGDTLIEKVKSIECIVENTNIDAVFDLVLDACVNNNLPKEDVPKSIVIISDMQFDQGVEQSSRKSFYDHAKEKFERAGYDIPNVVFWNVASSKNAYQVSSEYKGVQLASGSSPSVFKTLVENIGKTPYEAMLNVLNSERYSDIFA